MGKRISVVFLISLFALFIFVGGALGAADARKSQDRSAALRVDGAQPPGEYAGPSPSPVFYESGMQPNCEDINPVDPIVILQHEEWGMTYYDYQKNGSMGRMIAVSCGGHRSMVFHETRGDYADFPRYVSYNCKDPVSVWCGPMWMDGGPGINAGYANMSVMNDGTEIIFYHRTAPPIGCWNTSLARGEYGEQCQCYIIKKYDLPDRHQDEPDGQRGMWPKGYVMYDAVTDTDYIHIVTTESTPAGETYQTIAYQRCVFQGNTLVCHSPGGLGPYTREPGVGEDDPDHVIAVIDDITTISAIATGSPVSKRVAIVYTKSRGHDGGGGCEQHNNDVVYIESMNNGDDWLDGTQWPPTIHNVSNYEPLTTERAYCDVAACYDYNDSLHIVWNSTDFDSVTCSGTNGANLVHWSKEHQVTIVAPGYWGDTDPGAWNYNICKMSISAKDPIYHPGGDPDSVFLFCTWTQFDSGDNSKSGMTNGDIYTGASNDGGELWTKPYNLTNTKTPDCEPGACLSEHWSSMAENMYDGDLHIEYVCDRDAGGIVQPDGDTWTDNPMMYMHVEQYEVKDACGVAVKLIEPPDWCDPPLKISPGEFRLVILKLTGIYNVEGDYEVTTDHPDVVCVGGCGGTLAPGGFVEVTVKAECPPGEEGFIAAKVIVRVCIDSESGDEDTIAIALHAVCSDDYFECPIDPATYIEKDNDTLRIKIWANTQEQVWDNRLVDTEDETIQPIFSGGVVVCTHDGGDTVAGRQDYNTNRTGARDTINVDEGFMEPYFPDEKCMVQLVYVRNTFICANHLEPPKHLKWWWIDIHKNIIMFHDTPEDECPIWKKEQIIKKIWIDYSEPPVWWPNPGEYPGHENICFGYFADVDAPFDTGCNGCNTAGYSYDPQDEFVWFHGYNAESHPEYEDYHVGLAFTDDTGAVVAPYAAHVVRNDSFLYPQAGWGWKDGQLCSIACTPGVSIQDQAIDTLDRTVVMTAEVIPAGPEDTFEADFILIEAFIPEGFDFLQQHIRDTRDILIPQLNELGLFRKDYPELICGDVNSSGIVDIADVVYLVTYLFQDGPQPKGPIWMGDVNSSAIVDIADVVFLVTYLFQDGPLPKCSGFGRQP